jgi:CRISPR/Cas system-associated exonuclease Cas4 (RecB family)
MKDPVQVVYEQLREDGIHEVRQHTAPPKRFRASEAANCVRQTWYRLNGDRPAPRDAVGYIYGINGDVDHDVTRQLFNHHGQAIGGVTFDKDGEATEHMWGRKEYNIEQAGRNVKFTLTCRADGSIETPRGDSLLEIKGMGHWPYEWLNKAFVSGGHAEALDRVKKKHSKYLYQVHVTMALTGYRQCYLLVKDRGTGTLGLHNPDTGERSGIYIEFDDELWETMLQRFAYIQRKLDEGKPPPPEFAAGSNDCKYCPFNYLCHEANERRARGIEPAVLYPGPQFEEHVDNE